MRQQWRIVKSHSQHKVGHTMKTLKIPLTSGTYLAACATAYFKALDGSDIAAWLTAHGHTVTGHRDTGRNGEAYTSEGFTVCSNGYTYRTPA